MDLLVCYTCLKILFIPCNFQCEVFSQTNHLGKELRNWNKGGNIQIRNCEFPKRFIDFVDHSTGKSININGINASKLNSTDFENSGNVINKMLMDNLETLWVLIVTESNIWAVDDNSFEDNYRLRIINLRHNKISTLSKNLFSYCKRLKEIYLGDNRIKQLPDSIFIHAEDLVSLDLSYNQLKVIDSSDLFKKTTQIERLYLEGNCISMIHGNTFNKLSSLVFLNLSHNCMSFSYISTCNGQVSIPENYFWLVDTALMSNGSLIDLRFNKIVGIPLEGIRKSCLHNRCRPVTLLLKDNPLSCGCDGYDLISYIQGFAQTNVAHSIQISKDLTCITSHNERRLLSEVSPDNVFCDLAACPNCPPMCTCHIHRNTSTVIVNCQDKNLKTIPPELPISRQDRSEMWLGGNQLKNITSIPYPYMVSVLSVPHNNILELPLFFTKLQNLRVLELHNNSLKIMLAEEVRHIQSLNLQRLTLGNNRWNCSDCRILAFLKLLKNFSHFIADRENITCWDSNNLVIFIDPAFCKKPSPYFLITLVAIISVLMLTIVFFFWRKIKPKILVNLPTNELDDFEPSIRKYDAFVSYSHEDENYVARLVETLESCKEPYKLCLHSRNWTPGEYIVKQMTESVSQSRASIIVLSTAYLKSRWCYSEFRIALTHMLVRRNHKVIAIWLSDQDPNKGKLDPDFRLYFSTCTYLRYNDDNFMNKLRSALAH